MFSSKVSRGSRSAIIAIFFFMGAPVVHAAEWKLIWSDEFNRSKGTPPDTTKWTYDLGGGGWGNHELEEYTSDSRNVSHDGAGRLAIRLLRENDGRYTSARIKTLGKFEWTYGRVAARIKIPSAEGLWPAVWMLGNNFPTIGWPGAGEIDIMENRGKEPSIVYSTLHGPGYSAMESISLKVELPRKQRFAGGFHTFSAEWSPNTIEFSLDGRRYGRVTVSQLPPKTRWVFDHPFFILLNLAIGGDWSGPPDRSTVLPQEMLIDWIRVWQLSE